jgi:hypothetical protein
MLQAPSAATISDNAATRNDAQPSDRNRLFVKPKPMARKTPVLHTRTVFGTLPSAKSEAPAPSFAN